MKNILLTSIGLVFIGFSVFFFLKNPAKPNIKPLGTRYTTVEIASTTVKAEISDTEAAREQGLSGARLLGAGEAMLFIFQMPGRYGFWMKDMNFPLDIIGLDTGKRVVWEERSLAPDTYPQVFSPQTSILYVLELPAGFIDAHHVDMGSVVSFVL